MVNSKDGFELLVPIDRFEYFIDKYSDVEAEDTRSAEQGALTIRINNDDLDKFIKIKTKGYYTVEDVIVKAEDDTPVEIYNNNEGILFKGTRAELFEGDAFKLNTLIKNFAWLPESEAIVYEDDWGYSIEV